MNEDKCNPGATLVDITTFVSVQRLLDNPTSFSDHQILDFCSLLDALVLSNRIVILEPLPSSRKIIPSPYPNILKELSAKCGNIEVLHWPEKRKIDDVILALASEIASNEQEKKFLEQYSKSLDVTGYFKTLMPGVLGKTTLKRLESLGFSAKSGILYGLGHEYRAREYLRCCVENCMPYYPHYIREPVLRLALNKAASIVLLAREYVKKLEMVERERRQTFNSLKAPAIFDLDFPAIPTYIASRCKNPSQIIDETINLVKDRDSRKFRDYMERFERAILMGGKGRKQIENYERTIEDYMNSLALNKRNPGYELHSVASIGIEGLLPGTRMISTLNLATLASKVTDAIYKWGKRRQLTFLGALTKNVKEITSSRAEFERLFKRKIAIIDLRTLRERVSNMDSTTRQTHKHG